MKKSVLSILGGFSLVATMGCGNGTALTEQDSTTQPIKACQLRDPESGACMDNNGDDINNPRAKGYDFPIHHTDKDWGSWSYRLTGFYLSGTTWKVRGWKVNPDVTSTDPNTRPLKDGEVLGIVVGGKPTNSNP